MQQEVKAFYNLWFVILGVYLIEFGFTIINSVMIAPFGAKYLAGVGIAGICYSVILSFSNGFISILINIYAREEIISQQKASLNTVYLIMLILIVISHSLGAAILFKNVNYLMDLLYQPKEVIQIVQSNLSLLSFSYPVSLFLAALNIFLRVHNQANVVLRIFIIGTIVNILSNFLLMYYQPLITLFKPHIAVAISTIISEIVMLFCNLLFCYMIQKPCFVVYKIQNSLSELTKKFLFITTKALPVGLRNISDWLSSLLLVFFINSLGVHVGAANQIADVVSSLMYRAPQAACVTIGIIYSKFIGIQSNKTHNSQLFLKKLTNLTILAAIPSFIIALVFFVIRPFIPNLFGFNNQHIVHVTAISILTVHFIFFLAYFLQHVFNAFLDAFLDTKIPAIATFIVYYIFMIPVAFYMTFYYQTTATTIWVIEGIGITILAILNLFRIINALKLPIVKVTIT